MVEVHAKSNGHTALPIGGGVDDEPLGTVTPDMPALTDHDRLIASIHHDSDGWVRGFWANTWHFKASEADVLQLLADDRQEGRVPI